VLEKYIADNQIAHSEIKTFSPSPRKPVVSLD